MVIKNGTVLCDNFEFCAADIKIDGAQIVEIGNNLTDSVTLDATGCFVVPGFVDTHMHGANGAEFINGTENTYKTITSFEAKNGTTALVPAISAAPEEKLLSCVQYMKDCTKKEEKGCAKIYGMHLEGPFFSQSYRGAHKTENIRKPDLGELKKLLDQADGCIKILTIAPELPDAEKVIKYAVEQGVCVSAGHTDADFEQIRKALSWGVTQGTHLFNAMSPLKHRAPGAVGALLSENVKCELICDFFHVAPEVVQMVYRLKGREQINIITDSEIGTGLPDGVYKTQDRTIIVENRETRYEDGTICGGSTCMIDGVRNLVSVGIPLADACMMASKNPAMSVGIFDQTGSITKGKLADLVILDQDLQIKQIILRGERL